MLAVLSDFQHIRPRHEIAQEKILEWISQAHGRAEKKKENAEHEEVYHRVREKLFSVRGKADQIETRGIHVNDLLEEDWEKMEIYPAETHPPGRGFKQRSDFFEREASEVLERFYPEGATLPAHLVHVTCTGYVSPSPAQRIVSIRGAGGTTTVTHAYHMGCYGALSGIRIGAGLLSLPCPAAQPQVDIVHTELCSLHMHPLRHTTDQLIVQSLFADGFIKYSLSRESHAQGRPHFKILALHEETIPDSKEYMTWRCEDHGLSMTLSKEVPVVITRYLEGYLKRLAQLAHVDFLELKAQALFAVHPGGPKILQHTKALLGLEGKQMQHSQKVLRDFGNMSSATLPHIWELMLADSEVPIGTKIVGLAFGPGLCISGALLEKGG